MMDPAELQLSDKDFERVKTRVYKLAGISLSEAKRTLVTSRLTKLVKAMGLKTFEAYIDHMERSASEEDTQQFVNALTTNLTRFYREEHHFDHLAGYVKQLVAQPPRLNPNGKPRLRIWSAGCSTGQEPYSIALCLLDAFPELQRWDFKILATDIDTNVVARAAKGVYPDTELNNLSKERAAQFEKLEDGKIQIPDAARKLVAFKTLNLMADWPMSGPFDAIFCRNVAIYFDRPTQNQMFSRFHTLLAPDGFLYIGHSETLASSASLFSLVGQTIYRSQPQSKERSAA